MPLQWFSSAVAFMIGPSRIGSDTFLFSGVAIPLSFQNTRNFNMYIFNTSPRLLSPQPFGDIASLKEKKQVKFSAERKKISRSLIRHDISSKKLWLSQNYNEQPVAEPKDLCARQELQNVVCSLPSHHLHLPPPLKAVGCSSTTHLTQLCLLLLQKFSSMPQMTDSGLFIQLRQQNEL